MFENVIWSFYDAMTHSVLRENEELLDEVDGKLIDWNGNLPAVLDFYGTCCTSWRSYEESFLVVGIESVGVQK